MPAIVLTVNANGEVGDLWNWQNFTGVRFARYFASRMILLVSSTMQTHVPLTETPSPAKWSTLRFSF